MNAIVASSKRFSTTGASRIAFWNFWNMFLAPICFRDAGISSYQLRDEFSCTSSAAMCGEEACGQEWLSLMGKAPRGTPVVLGSQQAEGKCGLSIQEAWAGKRVWYLLQSRCVILSATQKQLGVMLSWPRHSFVGFLWGRRLDYVTTGPTCPQFSYALSLSSLHSAAGPVLPTFWSAELTPSFPAPLPACTCGKPAIQSGSACQRRQQKMEARLQGATGKAAHFLSTTADMNWGKLPFPKVSGF